MSIMIVKGNIHGKVITRKVYPESGSMYISKEGNHQEVLDGEAVIFNSGIHGMYPFRVRGMKGAGMFLNYNIVEVLVEMFPEVDWSTQVIHALNGDFCMNPTGNQKDLKEVTLVCNTTVAKMVKGSYDANTYVSETKNKMVVMHTNHGHNHGAFNVQQGQCVNCSMDELESLKDVKEAEAFLKSFETNPENFSSNELVRKYHAFNNFASVASEEENAWKAVRANMAKGNAVKYNSRSYVSYDIVTLLGCYLGIEYKPALHIGWMFDSNLKYGKTIVMRDPATSKYSPRIQYNRKPLAPQWIIEKYYIPGVTYIGVEDFRAGDPEHCDEVHFVTDLNCHLQYDCDGDHTIEKQDELLVNKVLEMNLAHPIANEMVIEAESKPEFFNAEGKARAEVAAALGSKMGIPAKVNFQLCNGGIPAAIKERIPEDMNEEDVLEYFQIVIEVMTQMYIDLSKHGGTTACKTFDVILKNLMHEMALPYAKRFDKNGAEMCRKY